MAPAIALRQRYKEKSRTRNHPPESARWPRVSAAPPRAACLFGRRDEPCDRLVSLKFLEAGRKRCQRSVRNENPIWVQLSQAQTAYAIARRKAIYLELHPETRARVAGGLARQGPAKAESVIAFTKATATATGKAERTVREIDARGEALGGALKDIAGPSSTAESSLTRRRRNQRPGAPI